MFKAYDRFQAAQRRESTKPKKITKATVDAQVKHHREQYRRNHPTKPGG